MKIPTLIPALKIPPTTLQELNNREAIRIVIIAEYVFITVFLLVELFYYIVAKV